MNQVSAPQEIAIYKSQNGSWQKTVLATNGSNCIRLVDLTGSGRLNLSHEPLKVLR